MTHITREAYNARAAQRAEIRDNVIGRLFTPYTFLCLILMLGGLSLALFDAKGIPFLIISAVLVAIVRLLYTLREAVNTANMLQQENNTLLRLLIQRIGNSPIKQDDL